MLHTKPRGEKALARRLLRAEQPYFLPVYKRESRVQRRRVTSFLPLFPGYMFVHGEDAVREAVYSANLVANVIPVVDQQRLVDDLERVYTLIASDEPLAPEDQLERGMPAEIVKGPLAGQRGTIVRRNGRTKLVISIDFLQQGTSVEIDPVNVRAY